MKSNKLTFIESIMLVAGAGIGTGILTIPYAASKIGFFGTILAIIIAYVVTLITYLFIADLTLNSKDSAQLLGILKQHLFKGKYKKILATTFFVIFVIILLQNLIVYLMCATNIFTELFSIPVSFSKILFYLLASTVLIFGIKGIGVGEKIAVPLIATVILLLIGLSAFNIQNNLTFTFGEPSIIVAVFGLFMFAFSAIFSVVQVTNNIDNPKNIKKVLTIGLSINTLLTLIFTIASIIGSKEITEVATIGLTDTIGKPWVKILCSIFVLLAMFTSYWSSGLAFADVLKGGGLVLVFNLLHLCDGVDGADADVSHLEVVFFICVGELAEVFQRASDGVVQFLVAHKCPEAFHAALSVGFYFYGDDGLQVVGYVIYFCLGVFGLSCPVE